MKSELSEYCKQMSPNKTKRDDKVTKIIIHHMAGILTCEQCASIFAKPSRCASANYLIGRDGKIVNSNTYATHDPCPPKDTK